MIKEKFNALLFLIIIILCGLNTKAYASTCYIGDSRTVGMQQVVDAATSLWCCKVGAGYDYLITSGTDFITEHDREIDTLVILLGVNDLYNKEKYLSYINNICKNSSYTVYFVSVNPVIDTKSIYVKNRDIFEFNFYIKNMRDPRIHYIDTFSNVQFKYLDGIHYTNSTYREIYDIIYNSIIKEIK